MNKNYRKYATVTKTQAFSSSEFPAGIAVSTKILFLMQPAWVFYALHESMFIYHYLVVTAVVFPITLTTSSFFLHRKICSSRPTFVSEQAFVMETIALQILQTRPKLTLTSGISWFAG